MDLNRYRTHSVGQVDSVGTDEALLLFESTGQ